MTLGDRVTVDPEVCDAKARTKATRFLASRVLDKLEGKSLQEIAELFNVSVNTVKTHIRRGKAALRANESLAEYVES